MTRAAALPAAAAASEPRRLWPWSLFAGVLAAAGLPIYMHAPKVYADDFGVSLAALGAVLFALRLIDVVQDPALGWLAARLAGRRRSAVAVAAAVLAGAMAGLFALPPPVAPLLWFALMMTLLFSAYSYLTIAFYAEGVGRAEAMGAGGHVRLAAWREVGALAGLCLAAAAPALLAGTGAPYAAFALVFSALALAAVLAMRGEWQGSAGRPAGDAAAAFRAVLGDATARRLLGLALLNALPLAVTSTLFLFFVESRLRLPGWEGPLLILFFVAAAASVPLWGRLGRRMGAKRALMLGMVLAIASFVGAALLGPGDLVPFALICLASGAALGADFTLLPALFAGRMARIAPGGAEGFGLWTFAAKLALALAAATVLPALGAAGFAPGAAGNPPGALAALSILYALIPCALKLVALALLAAIPLPEG
jgi:GPH family glycoside/pentoside/hexuronide:cation symporter